MGLLGVVMGLCFFIVPLWSYRKGLQDGLRINKGKDIAPIKSPLTKVKTEVKNDAMLSGFNNIMNYDGTPQKEVEE